jgi:hippurate hydrolase
MPPALLDLPFLEDIVRLRRNLHAHPELAFQETRTAAVIADELARHGLDVYRGLAETGVIGVLRAGSGQRMIALRADMDALPMTEKSQLAYQSVHHARMHACGHDGHTAMLLGAARYLAAHRDFDGAVVFIFQPAEESEGGAQRMLEDGLFERFPVEAVYGLHNWPSLPLGQMAVHSGAVMAGTSRLEIRVRGKGCHAAMPETGVDTILAASHLVTLLQGVCARTLSPLDNAVVSITRIDGGTTWNVMPDEVMLLGTIRSFDTHVQERIEAAIERHCAGTATAFGATVTARFERRYPPTINHAAEAGHCLTAARQVLGEANVQFNPPPAMTAEDFAYMLAARPGCYVWLGITPSPETPGKAPGLHNPHYDFNDDAIPIGIAYWVALVKECLGRFDLAAASN